MLTVDAFRGTSAEPWREDLAREILRLPPTQQELAIQAALDAYGPARDGVDTAITFGEFVREAWGVVEPRFAFMPNWHIDAIVEHLDAVMTGEIRNLLIAIPPRFGKSTLVAVLWPAYVWTAAPETQWIFASYAQRFSERDSVRCRALVQSPWYQRRWGHLFQLRRDQNQKWKYVTDKGGHRIATSPEGVALGDGGDVVVGDDVHKTSEVHSDTMRASVLDWWDTTMSTRVRDPKTSRRVLIMQRLHERDVIGHLLDQGGYEYLCLPMEYEPSSAVTSIGWSDPRQVPNELLWPERFGQKEVADLKHRLGSYAAAAQLQQRPAPAGGGMFKEWSWRYWQHPGQRTTPVIIRSDSGMLELPAVDLPETLDEQIQSWDMTFKDTIASDYVVGQVWGRKGANRFLLDQVRQRLSFPETIKAVRALSAKWPKAVRKLIEDKANGPAVIATLRNELVGLTPVNPEGGKIARAHTASTVQESNNLFLPHPQQAAWAQQVIHEHAVFPNGAHDDMVDACSQAQAYFCKGKRGFFV